MYKCNDSPPDERYTACPPAATAAPRPTPPAYVLSVTSYGME